MTQIHFDGDWTEAEQRLVESAIADAEKRHAPIPVKGPASKSWICYCKRLADGAVFLAHRWGWQRVLYACSSVELALDIIFDAS